MCKITVRTESKGAWGRVCPLWPLQNAVGRSPRDRRGRHGVPTLPGGRQLSQLILTSHLKHCQTALFNQEAALSCEI